MRTLVAACARLAIVCLLSGAQVSAAAGPALKLPPSGEWEAAVDPVPQPDFSEGKFFTWKKNPDVRLRVGTVKAMRQDYSQAWVMTLAEEMGKQARAAGRDLRVTEGLVFELDGATVAKLRTIEGSTQVLLYWLPGDEGDVALYLLGANGAWDDDARTEVERSVNAVKGLRRRAASLDESVETAAGVAVLAVIAMVVIGALAALALRKRTPGA